MMLTKIATKHPRRKAIALNAICLGAVCLTSVVGYLGFAPSAFAQYGLGLPKSASAGGATRTTSTQILSVILLVPMDGAKTLASRPTFLWYINLPEETKPTSNRFSNTSDKKNSIKVTFFLRDGNEKTSVRIFEAEGKAEKSGLYRFTLPEVAPELVTGKIQRWQVRCEINGVQSDVYAPIRRDVDPAVITQIASSNNDLEKARIYAKNAYWYDAIDAYTSWLSQNPKDNVASTERSELFKVGLKNHFAFIDVKSEDDTNTTEEFNSAKFTNFLSKLDENKNVISIELKPKKK
ncbi:DUF928 domain-containing protein [Pseudanabaena sp. ABRG5-3]|uniref:DUF928 domain-containing protein n=1 Tax=Pseudanabaena sp. ABRG5-3 TaxID=685565 RepID=UPI000DC73EB2|nr:DUF928 domain-containing protein [Pseudanabaena sp. ABRG5-3]BBC26087.1 hypothetical protein ABRG53_3830 [Pseudanabaena sp. ABRG5-3]